MDIFLTVRKKPLRMRLEFLILRPDSKNPVLARENGIEYRMNRESEGEAVGTEKLIFYAIEKRYVSNADRTQEGCRGHCGTGSGIYPMEGDGRSVRSGLVSEGR